MMFPITYSTVYLSILAVHIVTSHPWGAPETACKNMYPLHHHGPQSSPSPFIAQPHKTEIFSNSTLQLTLQLNLRLGEAVDNLGSSESGSGSKHGKDIQDFKGYMIMGFDKMNDTIAIGSFITPEGSHTIHCHGGRHNAATHSTKSHKNFVKLSWVPPVDFEGEVIFKTMFVASKKYFWNVQVSTPVVVKLGDQLRNTLLFGEYPEEEILVVEEYDVNIIEINQTSYIHQASRYLSLRIVCSFLLIAFTFTFALKLFLNYRTKKYATLDSQL